LHAKISVRNAFHSQHSSVKPVTTTIRIFNVVHKAIGIAGVAALVST